MASRRTKRRRRLFLFAREFWHPLSFFLLISVVIAGMWLSPLTRITTARIIGYRDDDIERLKRVLRNLKTKPALQIKEFDVEQSAEANPAVLASNFSANIFGRCTLEVKYRVPVALAANLPGFGVDAKGFVFPLEAGRQAPSLAINVQDSPIYLTISDRSHVPAAARLAEKLQVLAEKLKGIVDGDAAGRLNLQIPGGVRIVFGDADRLEAKMQVLLSLASSNPAIFEQSAILNIVEPEAPTVESLK